MKRRKTNTAYEALTEASVRSLKPGELWCVYHPEGPLEQTASERMDVPVIIACEALKMDWGDLTEQGFYLGTIVRPVMGGPDALISDGMGER